MTEWRAIRGWPEYEVSDGGQVRRVLAGGPNAKVGRILKPGTNTDGYHFVRLHRVGAKKYGLINRLVCEAWHGQPPTPEHEAAHWNGVRTDNAPTNLRWATGVENQADKIRHGTATRGERNALSKLTDAQILEIRSRPSERHVVLAAEYGVTPENIAIIQSGKGWKHLGGVVDAAKRRGLSALTREQEIELARRAAEAPKVGVYFKRGELSKLAKHYGISVWTAMRIIKGTRGKERVI